MDGFQQIVRVKGARGVGRHAWGERIPVAHLCNRPPKGTKTGKEQDLAGAWMDDRLACTVQLCGQLARTVGFIERVQPGLLRGDKQSRGQPGAFPVFAGIPRAYAFAAAAGSEQRLGGLWGKERVACVWGGNLNMGRGCDQDADILAAPAPRPAAIGLWSSRPRR